MSNVDPDLQSGRPRQEPPKWAPYVALAIIAWMIWLVTEIVLSVLPS